MNSIVVIGGGFAGLWSAVGAARKLDELGIGPDQVEVTLINRDAWHGTRVRNYESDLSDLRVPLDSVLEPTGIRRIEGEVIDINPNARHVTVQAPDGQRNVTYDRLVVAAGSRVFLPEIPGLAAHGMNVDIYDDAERLDRHLRALCHRASTDGRDTVLVIGAGLTGIEVACHMPGRLKAAGIDSGRIILADRLAHIGSDMGEHARPVIDRALDELGVETRTAIEVTAVDDGGVTLTDGERIAADTVVWCAGMVASPLAASLPGARDRWGRLPVDEFMKVEGFNNVYAAGDIASARLNDEHASVMSCQHARPMGRFAGHNAVSDLLGEDQLALRIPNYSTCLDLGPEGAVQTQGWDRLVFETGDAAKQTKQNINCVRIYPPGSGDRNEILAAAAPVVQAAPGRLGKRTDA
jgi:NADH dehydrogenase